MSKSNAATNAAGGNAANPDLDVEIAKLRQERRLARLQERKVKAEATKRGGFLDRVFNDPLYKWAGYLVLILIFIGVVAGAYFLYTYIMVKVEGGAVKFDGSVREAFLNKLATTFTLENIFTIAFVSDSMTPLIGGAMFFLGFKDQRSFNRNQHTDFKGIISSLGVFGTFVGVFLGLYGFDPGDIDGSVPKLLTGLKTAFLTSVFGLGITVVLTYVQTRSNTGLQSEIELLREINESLASLDDGQELAEKQQQMLRTMQSYSKVSAEQDKLAADFLKNSLDTLNQIAQSNVDLTRQISELKQTLGSGSGSPNRSVPSPNASSTRQDPFAPVPPPKDLFG